MFWWQPRLDLAAHNVCVCLKTENIARTMIYIIQWLRWTKGKSAYSFNEPATQKAPKKSTEKETGKSNARTRSSLFFFLCSFANSSQNSCDFDSYLWMHNGTWRISKACPKIGMEKCIANNSTKKSHTCLTVCARVCAGRRYGQRLQSNEHSLHKQVIHTHILWHSNAILHKLEWNERKTKCRNSSLRIHIGFRWFATSTTIPKISGRMAAYSSHVHRA